MSSEGKMWKLIVTALVLAAGLSAVALFGLRVYIDSL